MPLSVSPAKSGGKRRRKASRSRARKKHKRLDAICDKPSAPSTSSSYYHLHDSSKPPSTAVDGSDDIRRSSRVRRAPVVLDSSPVPYSRRKNPQLGELTMETSPSSDSRSKKKKKMMMKKKTEGGGLEIGKPLPGRHKEMTSNSPTAESRVLEVETEDWRSRLRARARATKGRGNSSSLGKRNFLSNSGGHFRKEKALDSNAVESRRRGRKRLLGDEVSKAVERSEDQAVILPSSDVEANIKEESPEQEIKVDSDLQVDCEPHEDLETAEGICEVREEANCTSEGGQDECDHSVAEQTVLLPRQLENVGAGDHVDAHPGEQLNDKARESEDVLNKDNLRPPIPDDPVGQPHVKEGRRCGLCGGGTDGRPPNRLVQEFADSENEAYAGPSASEEPNYDVWDGFGDEPGWLGKLLGPIHDRFGIARVWVHQHCAVWSPEVYFAGLGCLKNVRAALFRGRALKCSHCGRPGATIGCRVDRCPKTYHLPCGRADGCIFDHKKFLIACTDHRHLFQPQGSNYSHQIRKMKAKKLKLDMRKLSNDSWRKDLETEEKWLENCGEDEEFLKREGKRLHRDILRISPVYIGGSSENEKLYQGWESVAGLQEVIQCMKEVVILPLLYPEFFSTLGLTPPRGVLLHGYPGTGKTLVVRALIGACSRGDKRIAYFARKGADCLGKYVGDAERQLRLLFQVAERSQPSIIFFDEIDGLAPRRSRHQDQTHSSVVSTLLSLMDGLKSRGSVIVIGATNRPEAVDPALRRPGRFDREVYFPLPSVKDRSAILSLHTQSWPNPVSGHVLSWIANQTVGYAGADLQSLCTQAAMFALKRNCALQELLSSAEKGFGHGRRPSLPSFVVEERDWLEALTFSPPPCSRREAGMAANDVVSAPLQPHLIPCLLRPLSQLLISFYIDERTWLPPALLKASKSIKSVIFSALEQKRIPTVFWWSHLHDLIQEPFVANEIEKNLNLSGLLIGSSGFTHSYTSDDDNGDDYEKFDSCRSKPSGASMLSTPMQKFCPRWGNVSGFRALIAGSPRSGQQHLASCLLHGFMGHIEIQKVNLATIAQEGHGDIVHGMDYYNEGVGSFADSVAKQSIKRQQPMKCLNVGRCVIYMPRIDLWAMDETLWQDTEVNDFGPKSSKSSRSAGVHDAIKSTSQAWNSFVEQVESVCTSASIVFLATCEVQNQDLPLGIRQFFTDDLLDHTDSAPSEHTVPRFFVQSDGNFDLDLVISLAAAKLSQDLVQHYVQLVHHKTHTGSSHDEVEDFPIVKVNLEPQGQSMENNQATLLLETPIDSSKIPSNSGASCRENQTEQDINGGQERSPLSKMRGHHLDVQLRSHQDSFPKILPNKVMKGSPLLAIATVGYQILRYPQFAELCWVTSKLKEGPCTDINGPWKGWPFNSCVLHPIHSSDKVVAGVSSSNLNDREHYGVVRGLIAVGLLAYRGVYTTIREVSYEVRKVLELLVGQISDKILSGKDRHRYLWLLSQVAYVEDIVNSWAYTFQSLQIDNQTESSNTKPVIVGRQDIDNNAGGRHPTENSACMPSVVVENCNEVPEIPQKGSPQKYATRDTDCVNFSNGLANHAFPNADASMVPESKHFQESFPSSSLPSSLDSSSSLTATAFISGDGPCRSWNPTPGRGLESMKQSSGLAVKETIFPSEAITHNLSRSILTTRTSSQEVHDHCNGSRNVLSSDTGGQFPNELGTVTDLTCRKNNNLSPVCEISCLYDCCSECLHAVHMLARNILSDSWKYNSQCSTVDDAHDVVASCSLNLLSVIRKCYTSRSSNNSEEYHGRKHHESQAKHCACMGVGDVHLQKMSFQLETSEDIEFLPMKCSCHLRDKEDTATENTSKNSLFHPASKYFFRDGVLMPSNPQKDAVLHCKSENLCVCSVVEMISMIK